MRSFFFDISYLLIPLGLPICDYSRKKHTFQLVEIHVDYRASYDVLVNREREMITTTEERRRQREKKKKKKGNENDIDEFSI